MLAEICLNLVLLQETDEIQVYSYIYFTTWPLAPKRMIC